MNQRTTHPLTVTGSQIISPSFRRITLQGESIAPLTSEHEGKYFKLLFTKQGGTDLSELGDERPVMRTYTVRDVDLDTNSFTVDLVRHVTHDASCGFAARWGETAQVGDTISIVGFGSSPYPAFDRDTNLFVADMTALPGLSAVLKKLPDTTQGHAFIEVSCEADIQPLSCPAGVDITWVIAEQNQSLVDAVRALPWPVGKVDVWCACEFETMRALRKYFRNEHEVEKDHIYISSYWKDGVTEEGHKVIKREDMEQAG